MSHPLWMRGLKFTLRQQEKELNDVASFMDAWIEITPVIAKANAPVVASFMDAWIEMMMMIHNPWTFTSHPLWMRGLK